MTSLSFPKSVRLAAALLACISAMQTIDAAGEMPYEAAFVDGSRAYGDKLSGWGAQPVSPRLDNTPLQDPKRRLRWLRARRIEPWRPGRYGPGYIEFVGGDRLVGRIVGADEGDGARVAAHLLVKPTDQRARPLRILPGRIRRVVFKLPARRRLRPGTLYYQDNRKVGFSSLRWGSESVAILLKSGALNVKLADIQEIHLPHIDPWLAYYRELAVLSPACRSRILRVETADGLIATASMLRLSTLPYETPARQQAAENHANELSRRLSDLEAKYNAAGEKLKQSRAQHAARLAESQKLIKAAQQSHDKSAADMRDSMKAQQKTDAAELAELDAKFTQKLDAAELAALESLTGSPEEEHAAIVEAFNTEQAKLRKIHEQSLKDRQRKLNQRRTQKQKQLERLIASKTQELKQRSKQLSDALVQPRRSLEAETAAWGKLRAIIESMKTQIESVRKGSADSWTHVIQPVWSLDPLSIRLRDIRMRWSFAPQNVPLCRIRPAATVSPPFLRRYTNRSFTGGPLRSGSEDYAWGFAVHAYSELRFALPKFATAFRSRVGLDQVAGSGGCARARVFVGSVQNRPVYESPLLIGSQKTVDTGAVTVKLPSDGPQLLVLQADPANRESASGAEPLNIRDKLDWLDPVLELSPAGLRQQVRRRIGTALTGRSGWSFQSDRSEVGVWTGHLDKSDKSGALPGFRTMLRADRQALKLRRKVKIGPGDKWLAVHLDLPAGENPKPGILTLRIDNSSIPPRKIPIRQA